MTPKETQAFIDAIFGSYKDEEITALEDKALAMDIRQCSKFLDRCMDELLKHYDFQIVIAAMEETLEDIKKASEDNDVDD